MVDGAPRTRSRLRCFWVISSSGMGSADLPEIARLAEGSWSRGEGGAPIPRRPRGGPLPDLDAAVNVGLHSERSFGHGEVRMAGKNVHSFNQSNFESEVLQSSVPVLVDFTATWCGPCKALAPIVEKIADEFEGKVKVGKLDIDDSPDITRKYGVRSVPTVLVFHGGQKKGQHVGLTTREKLIQLLGV